MVAISYRRLSTGRLRWLPHTIKSRSRRPIAVSSEGPLDKSEAAVSLLFNAAYWRPFGFKLACPDDRVQGLQPHHTPRETAGII